MFPLDLSYLRPNLGDDNRLYWRYLQYIGKVLLIEPDDLILYHPMNELIGATAEDLSAQNNDGAYTGVTLGEDGIGDGETCPLFDGTNGFNNIHSTPGFKEDFNGAEGTLACWAKVSGAGVWTDAANRKIIHVYVNANNFVYMSRRGPGNNELQLNYKAGGTQEVLNTGGLSDIDWMHLAITWSATDDKFIFYKDGSQVGATQTGLGTWAGQPINGRTNVGCLNTIGPTEVWSGWLAHPNVWTKALAPAQVLSLATV